MTISYIKMKIRAGGGSFRAAGGSFRAAGGSFRAAGCSPLLFLFMGNTTLRLVFSDRGSYVLVGKQEKHIAPDEKIL